MPSQISPRDQNFVPASLFEIDGFPGEVMPGQIDQATGRILVEGSGGGGGIAAQMQTDVFTASNAQTIFTASQTVAYTFGFYVNGALQTPNSDYTVSADVATLANGIPQGNVVVWVYSTT